MSPFGHLDKFSLNFSSLSFSIVANLLHPGPSLFLYDLSLSLRRFLTSDSVARMSYSS